MVVLSSPPGAGKTEVITTVAPYLSCLANLSVTIATPTLAGAYDLAARLNKKLEAFNKTHDTTGEVWLVGNSFSERRSRGVKVAQRLGAEPGLICVRTIASTRFAKTETDVLIVDEAYQATALSVQQAATYANQLLLVGDPGQIGPVVTIDTTSWDSSLTSPAKRSPDVFKHWDGAVLLHLESSFRLGPHTVEAIRGLYDFDFNSRRPPAQIEGLPEVSYLNVPEPATPADYTTMVGVIDHARSMIGRLYTYNGTTRPIEPTDIAVMASRNEQVSALESLVSSDRSLEGITVGTADSLQGGQWPIAVTVDPLLGARKASGHALTEGRLCVMCSRHIAHLSFITCPTITDLISCAEITTEEKTIQYELRSRLYDVSMKGSHA